MMNFSDLGTAEKQLNSKIFDLCQKEKNFTKIETTGTTTLIYYNNKGEKVTKFYRHNVAEPGEELKPDYNSNIIPVLCKRVLSDVKKYLITKPLPEYNPDHFVTRDHHPGLMQQIDVGDIIHEVDINKFYWTYAYNEGIISPDTFKKYMKYKEARLIALGNLAKTIVTSKYIEGKLMEDFIAREKSPYAAFFYNIICFGYKVYGEVNRAIEGKVFYFQTDAFWVQPSMHTERRIKEVLNKYKHGYKVTRFKVVEKKPNEITVLNLATRKKKTVRFFKN